MNIQKLTRVFIHEIGHYVARELNFKLYNIGDGVERIFIKTHNLSNTIDYSGETTAKKPEGHVDNDKIENIAEFTAVIIYGCLFQTLYLKSKLEFDFRDCFSPDDSANGQCDFIEFRSMEKYISSHKRKEMVEYSESEYLNQLFKDQSHINKILNLKLLIYLKKENNDFTIKLDLLNKDLADFMTEHEKYYIEYLKNIMRIIN